MKHSKNSSEEQAGGRGLSLETALELCIRHTRLVIVVCVATLGASMFWLASKPPVYRANATLILESGRSKGGVLGELAALTSAPEASSEMELLRARTTAAETVRAAANDSANEVARHLDLTTVVEDLGYRPLREIAAGWTGGIRSIDRNARLHARIEPGVPIRSERCLSVEFDGAQQVTIQEVGSLGRSLSFGAPKVEATLVAGKAIAYRDLLLHLEPEGDLSGTSFLIHGLSDARAIERVLGATRVSETERNSGVIELLFDDCDPERAAQTANALCQNYLDRNKSRGEKRARQTVDFIDVQLAEQTTALDESERQVATLQRANPRAIDVGQVGTQLIEQMSKLEVERVASGLSDRSLGEALAALESGDTQALSRLGPEVADPITAAYVEQIARLEAESLLQERSDSGAYKTLLQQKSLELESRRDALAVELSAARSAADAVRGGSSEAVSRLGAGAPQIGDPLLTGYLAELSTLQARRDSLAAEFKPEHPDLALCERQLTAMRSRVSALLDNRVSGLEIQAHEFDSLLASYAERAGSLPAGERARIETARRGLVARTATHLESQRAGLKARSQSIATELERMQADMGSLPEEARVLADPLRRLAAHTEIVKFLLSRKQEAEISKAATVASAEFIDPAVAPLRRHGPSIVVHLCLGLVLGLVFALAAALLRESLSRRVFTASELEEISGLSVLGTIPDFKHGRFRIKGAHEHYVPLLDDPESVPAEAFRSLRANLKFALGAIEGAKTIAFTSCTQGEGKSLTNVSVALAYAINGKRVLLVDADMRRPSVHHYLGMELMPGLSEILQERVAWRECIRRDVARGLDVITAGKQPAAPGDLLESEACDKLLADLRNEYDLIVFDVPPALAVADIDSIASRLDAMFLVCKSNRVPAPVIAAATSRLRQVGAKLAGAALNAVGSSRGGSHAYGYGYGYGSEYGQRSGATVSERSAR
ncbi:MAG TPA: polysaccharide biosynthesis tyrosine autokinase [Planctomycetota bacterium]|nr:polysaccharide biosynthesis tyrosine autokinase [Planctomycetota bacterium]